VFKAILFDLDGTLLDIDMNDFLPHYFRKMMEMAVREGYEHSEQLVKQVFKSTEVMINNKNPALRNEEVFLEDFFTHWPYPREEFVDFFDRFYINEFPLLKQHTRPFPGIPEMMQLIMQKNLKVVIATNAVFPHLALQHRLEWAGVGHFDYDLITSYEVMHFCKPHTEYYLEIADIIGVKPHECLMVGNDIGEDLPANQVGMKTFLVENLLIDKGHGYIPDYRGTLDNLYWFVNFL
jgi:FMN phosphatase YigB (HAD superfamily)